MWCMHRAAGPPPSPVVLADGDDECDAFAVWSAAARRVARGEAPGSGDKQAAADARPANRSRSEDPPD